MNKVERLIEKFCPNGVEWKTLGEVVSIEKGEQLNKDGLLDEGPVPVINGGINPSGYWHTANFEANSITISQGGASAGYVNWLETPFWAGAHCYVLTKPKTCVNYRYIYHFAKWKQTELMSSQVGAGIPSVSSKKIASLSIPVPPLEVQSEIVQILDNFAKLTAELTAELAKRKKQYEHYRDTLLSGDWPRVKLGEIAKFVYGYTDKAKDTGNARFIRITDITEEGHLYPTDAKYITLTEEARKYLVKEGDLLMARTGATYGKTLYVDTHEPAVYASFLIRIVPDNARVLNRYYWHFSKSNLYWDQAKKLVTTGGQPQFNTGAISQVVIPLPPLAEQERIVGILDKFDKLVNSLTEGLPAEIAAREKQYAYYRDKLLSFGKSI